jgi:hypothetical protein
MSLNPNQLQRIKAKAIAILESADAESLLRQSVRSKCSLEVMLRRLLEDMQSQHEEPQENSHLSQIFLEINRDLKFAPDIESSAQIRKVIIDLWFVKEIFSARDTFLERRQEGLTQLHWNLFAEILKEGAKRVISDPFWDWCQSVCEVAENWAALMGELKHNADVYAAIDNGGADDVEDEIFQVDQGLLERYSWKDFLKDIDGHHGPAVSTSSTSGTSETWQACSSNSGLEPLSTQEPAGTPPPSTNYPRTLF